MSENEKKNKSVFWNNISLSIRGYRLWGNRYPAMLCSVMICSIVEALSPYVGIYLTAQIISEISGARDYNKLKVLVFWSLFSAVVISLLSAVVNHWKNYELSGQRYKLKKIFNEKLLNMDYSYVDDSKIQKLIGEIEQNDKFSAWGLRLLLQDFEILIRSVCTILGAVVMCKSLFTAVVLKEAGSLALLNNPVFILLIVVIMIVVAFIEPMLINKGNSHWVNFAHDVQKSGQYESAFGKSIQQYSRALDIRMYCQDVICKKYLYKGVDYADRAKKSLRPMRVYHTASKLASYFFIGIVYLFVCLKSWGGAFGVGSVTKYIGAITTMSKGVSELLRYFGDMKNNAGFLETVFRFLDMQTSNHIGKLTTEEISKEEFEIEFRNVSFKYPHSDNYALKDVSIKLTSGKRIAIVGRNGSGKSTFIKLLCGLYEPTDGEIYLNGVDIRKYDYQQYFKFFSVVFQDFKLLPFRLGENVSASLQYNTERVVESLVKSGFKERLQTLENGEETNLYREFSNDGVEISGGEAQKIAIARALYKDAPFMILDEPTAALDPIAEFEVYSKMKEIVGGKTAVFISHRLASCRFCDDIIVFRNGRLIQHGNHEELVEDEKGEYGKLWVAQAKYYAVET